MAWFPRMRMVVTLAALLAGLTPVLLVAQDDPNGLPLGDVARSLRKKTPPSQDVIDDDNLPKVMQQAEGRHASGSALKFLMAGEGKAFQVSAPDVTCSLSFTANVKSLLSSQYAQMELPASEVLKLEGPATIEGDALIISVYNRTDWHVSEVAVALTVVKKSETREASLSGGTTFDGRAQLLPALADSSPQESGVRPEKKPDVTLIYRMRAAAPPAATTVFSAPLNLELAPDEEWHWAIVQAKGYPPRTYGDNPPQTTAQTSTPASIQSASTPAIQAPENSPDAPTPHSPQ